MLAWRKEAANRFGEGGGAQYAEEELRHTHVQQVCNVQFYVLSVATLCNIGCQLLSIWNNNFGALLPADPTFCPLSFNVRLGDHPCVQTSNYSTSTTLFPRCYLQNISKCDPTKRIFSCCLPILLLLVRSDLRWYFSETLEHASTISSRQPSASSVHHMGQILQDGENPWFTSNFVKSRAFVWPNLIIYLWFFNWSWSIVSLAPKKHLDLALENFLKSRAAPSIWPFCQILLFLFDKQNAFFSMYFNSMT